MAFETAALGGLALVIENAGIDTTFSAAEDFLLDDSINVALCAR
jgi:hypothetical protein